MKFNRLFLWILMVTAGGVLLTTGCNSTTQRKWLTFFFDGVPPETSATNAPVSSALTGTNAIVVVSKRPVPPKPRELIMHKPYAEDKCAQCHQSAFSQQLVAPIPKLCFSCHKDFLAGAKVKHQPVENGDCKSCHDPHQSVNKNLLVKTGGKLCFDCHDDLQTQLAKAKSKHQPVENGECLSCHNAHATELKKLVAKKTPALCWDCHDNFLEKAKFKHDVVEDCASCHSPHQSGELKLLAKNISKLCFDCHEEKDIKAVKGHAGAETKSCMECHDPHVGTDAKLLKPAAKPK